MFLNIVLIKVKVAVFLCLVICSVPIILLTILMANILGILCKIFYRTNKSLQGDIALVTGGAHGLGRALSLELAKMGCHIAIADINLDGAEETVKLIREKYNVQAKAYKVDVTSYREISVLRSDVVRDLGPVTVLINNAGIILFNNSKEPEAVDVQRMIDVNLTSHFWTKDTFLPTMKQLRRGFIVSISSIAGLFPIPYNTTYVATKFGVNGHMKTLRMELDSEQQHDIHVCTVMPWFLETNDDVVHVTNKININGIYPPISGVAAAQRIVEGMLFGEREIYLPGFIVVIYQLYFMLPVSWQETLIRFISHRYICQFLELRG